MANDGQFIEFQSTGEEAKFSKQTIMDFIELVESSMPEIFNIQNLAIEKQFITRHQQCWEITRIYILY